MPVAVRIDIHLSHVHDSDQTPKAVRPDVKELAAKLADAVGDAIIEWSGGPGPREEQDENFLNPHTCCFVIVAKTYIRKDVKWPGDKQGRDAVYLASATQSARREQPGRGSGPVAARPIA